ncbi:DJ-1/PfpI family protein [Clostridium ihumii]|uniref:DJ-1/PfpI family protein n=1 Tax=Clostridium ihumii TaxID=1470356 RepID=UPI003D34085D
MNIYILYYDDFCEFEVVLAASIFKENCFSVALENRIYLSEEKQKYLPDEVVEKLNVDDVDMLIIPGGDPSYLFKNEKIEKLMQELNYKNKFIAGICGGVDLMANFHLLDNKMCTGNGDGILLDEEENKELYRKSIINNKKDVIIDKNCITAKGCAFIEFSIELGKIMNVYKDEKEMNDYYKWLKNIK